MPPKIAVITGPTATGKTALGVMLAQSLGGEVVSADSMQIYRRMSIGTAKPEPDEMMGIPHHMIDIAEPWESYSAARYVEEASLCVDDILARGRLPIIVGGTGLYIDSLISGRSFAGTNCDSRLRAELTAKYELCGGEKMLATLAQFDPERAAKLHPGDMKRIVRAIEVYTLTGETITQHDARERLLPPRYEAAVTALTFRDREMLYSRIDRRVDRMVQRGLFDEVRALLEGGLDEKSTAMQAIGYKEAVCAIRGETDEASAIELIKRESRRYAKRQLTWLRRGEGIFWALRENNDDLELIRQLSTAFLHSRGIK